MLTWHCAAEGQRRICRRACFCFERGLSRMFLSCQALRDEADSFGRSFRDVRGSSEQLRRFVWHTRHAEPLRNEQFSFLPSNNRRCGVLRSSPAAQSACSQQRRCRCHSSTLSDRRLCTHRLCVGGDNG